jgi:hypothetical protein
MESVDETCSDSNEPKSGAASPGDAEAIWLDVVSCLDALAVARAIPSAFSGATITLSAALSETAADVKQCARAARCLALESLRRGSRLEGFRAGTARLARAAWRTVDHYAPQLVPARRAASWTQPEMPDGRAALLSKQLRAFFAGEPTRLEIYFAKDPTDALDGATGPSEMVTLLQRMQRVRGPLPAGPSVLARLAAGVISECQVMAERGGAKVVDVTSRGEVWEELHGTAKGLRDRGEDSSFAALVVFAEAAYFLGPATTVLSGEDAFPFMVPRARAVVREVGEYDPPREVVRRALRALGHDPQEFTAAERVRRSREADKIRPNRARAPGGRPRKTPMAKAKR